jgi:hypothetical protein
MSRTPERYAQRKLGADITVDDVLLIVLEGGPATVNDVLKRFDQLLRSRLDKLRVRGIVTRKGPGGAHRNFTYELMRRPDIAAKALREKRGLAPAPIVDHQNGGF